MRGSRSIRSIYVHRTAQRAQAEPGPDDVQAQVASGDDPAGQHGGAPRRGRHGGPGDGHFFAPGEVLVSLRRRGHPNPCPSSLTTIFTSYRVLDAQYHDITHKSSMARQSGLAASPGRLSARHGCRPRTGRGAARGAGRHGARGGRRPGTGREAAREPCSSGEVSVLPSTGLIYPPGGKSTGEGRFRAKGQWDVRGRQRGRGIPDFPGRTLR